MLETSAANPAWSGPASAWDRYMFTTRFVELHESEAILVCVPTPLTRNREPDLGPLEE